MDAKVQQQLAAIVARFYQERGEAFAAHRKGPWPGFTRVLTRLPSGPVLDVGCGEGRFGVALERMWQSPTSALPEAGYVGVDACELLLRRARARSDLPRDSRFQRLDVGAHPGGLPSGPFAGVVALGLMHHVPGRARRRLLLDEMAARVAPGGILAITLWRFREVGRLERLELSFEQAGIDPGRVEPGDALLSFAGDPSVPRYCHFFDREEVDELAAEGPLPLIDRSRHDGREHELNEYLVWRRPE